MVGDYLSVFVGLGCFVDIVAEGSAQAFLGGVGGGDCGVGGGWGETGKENTTEGINFGYDLSKLKRGRERDR